MQLNVPPDLETLINKRFSSGRYESIEDVLRRAEHGEPINGAHTPGMKFRR